jgi:predicted Ser/Thr protein kinase
MIGTTLKHYRIDELLGQGGMGVVYKARDLKLDRPVAIKLLNPALLANPERRRRFLQEARTAAALSHPAIAQVYDIDEADGQLFIAMEFVDGRSVGRLIAEGELDLLSAVEIALQVAEGLARAHEAGILHRDIKSDNIMVTRDGHAKLLDFGLAKLMEPGLSGPAGPVDPTRTLTKDPVRTLPGTVVGTVPYMSPEQARGKDLDARSDIFSLGVVFYEMVTGELPFKGDTPLDTMHAIAYEEARPVTVIRRSLSPQVHRIVSRCLRKRPEDRYPDAKALAADLKSFKQDLESGTRTDLRPAERLQAWFQSLKASVPLGTKGIWILAAVLIVAIALLFTRVNWGSLIGPAIVGLFLYRFFRNKKKRLLAALAKRLAKLPEVKAIMLRPDQLVVVADRAPASLSLRVTSLVDEVNGKFFIGKHVTAEIKSDLGEAEFRNLLKQVGVVYVREDVLGGPAADRSRKS